MLTVLGGLAEFERELIVARTGEGRERAKAKGVRFGRPREMSHHQRREALERLDAGESVVDVARTFGVDRATLYRLHAYPRLMRRASIAKRAPWRVVSFPEATLQRPLCAGGRVLSRLWRDGGQPGAQHHAQAARDRPRPDGASSGQHTQEAIRV